MDIFYLGHSSFKLRGKTTTVVTDPFSPTAVGLKFPKNVEADIVTISHPHDDHNDVSQIGGAPFMVEGAGEYEVKGVGIVGIPTYHDAEKGAARGRNTIYNIEIDGIHIVHLGDLGHTLSSGEVDKIDQADILLVPVGGQYTITAKQAVEVIHELEPSIVIPMHYARSGLSDAFNGLTDLDEFLKEYGKAPTEPQPKLSITKDKLPEETTVVTLS